MSIAAQSASPGSPISWEPSPTHLPSAWVELSDTLARQARGSPHPYIMETKYEARRVGDLLRSWGLPWEVVMAGYLWEYAREEIERHQLPGTDAVIHHVLHATTYAGYIKDDNLPPLLTPPYEDLGGLLIAVAIYYEAFRRLQEVRSSQQFHRTLLASIERTGQTLINVAKRLGMWLFKREVEDITEQLCNSARFAKLKESHERILAQDARLLNDTGQWFTDTYRAATQRSIQIIFRPCGIVGFNRRLQDAQIEQGLQGKLLSGFHLTTFEIIVPTVEECYSALGVLSQLGLTQRMSDQIANPKQNGYSHITLDLQIHPQGPYSQLPRHPEQQICLCNIQIATPVMQAVTSYGVLYPASYELYSGRVGNDADTHCSPASLWKSESGKVFLTLHENIIVHRDLVDNKFPIMVYERKSRKKIMMPKGATALDFAFTLDHSIGVHAVYAIVNNRKSPLHRVLDADDIVEIITSTEIQAHESWLLENHAKIPSVRRQISASLQQQIMEKRGYKLLSQELERYHYILPPEALKEHLHVLVQQHSLGTVQRYLEQIDPASPDQFLTPRWIAQEIMQRIAERGEMPVAQAGRANWEPVIDKQLAGNAQRFYQQHNCGFCQPTYPRDIKIMGRARKRYHTLVVHKETCPYLSGSSQSLLIPMTWQLQPPAFRVGFFITAQDRKGLIHDLTRRLRRFRCDLLSINADTTARFGEAQIRFTIEAYSYAEVIGIWNALYRIDNVMKAELDISSTSLPVYDHLQKMHQRKEAPPQIYPPELIEEPAVLDSRTLILENPFDISHPASARMFFGRATEIETMRRELCDEAEGRALILAGPRRSGKTSICKNFLERHVRPPFWGVHFSLQNFVQHNEETILRRLAEATSEEFEKKLHQSAPAWDDFPDLDPQERLRKLLERCLAQVPHSRLILVLDEFGGALEALEQQFLERRFFSGWKELIDSIPQLSLVFVLPTSAQKQLKAGNLGNKFSFASTLYLEFLDTNSARQLLVDPLREQNIQMYSSTVALATRLTGGNPYYLTIIGYELVRYLNRETDQQLITDKDLRIVTEQLIQSGSYQYFDYLHKEFQNTLEERIIEGLVELTTHSRESKVQLRKLAHWLDLSPTVVRRQVDRLRDGLILDEIGNIANPYYSFKVELIRRWLSRHRWFFHEDRRRK